MHQLRYFKSVAVEQLAEKAFEHLDWYYSPQTSCGSHPLILAEQIRQSNLQVESLQDKLAIADEHEKPEGNDARNAHVVFETLKYLTPVQATDERLWVYLCHTDCKKYVANRWLSTVKPSDEKKIKQEISHFFVASPSKQRNLFRTNGISRLWWMGFLAYQISPDAPDQFLEILLHRQDVAVQIMTRSTTPNKRLLSFIFEILKENWIGSKELLERDVFREWMSQINFYGGVVLLDTLSDEQMRKKLREFSETALNLNQSKAQDQQSDI